MNTALKSYELKLINSGIDKSKSDSIINPPPLINTPSSLSNALSILSRLKVEENQDHSPIQSAGQLEDNILHNQSTQSFPWQRNNQATKFESNVKNDLSLSSLIEPLNNATNTISDPNSDPDMKRKLLLQLSFDILSRAGPNSSPDLSQFPVENQLNSSDVGSLNSRPQPITIPHSPFDSMHKKDDFEVFMPRLRHGDSGNYVKNIITNKKESTSKERSKSNSPTSSQNKFSQKKTFSSTYAPKSNGIPNYLLPTSSFSKKLLSPETRGRSKNVSPNREKYKRSKSVGSVTNLGIERNQKESTQTKLRSKSVDRSSLHNNYQNFNTPSQKLNQSKDTMTPHTTNRLTSKASYVTPYAKLNSSKNEHIYNSFPTSENRKGQKLNEENLGKDYIDKDLSMISTKSNKSTNSRSSLSITDFYNISNIKKNTNKESLNKTTGTISTFNDEELEIHKELERSILSANSLLSNSNNNINKRNSNNKIMFQKSSTTPEEYQHELHSLARTTTQPIYKLKSSYPINHSELRGRSISATKTRIDKAQERLLFGDLDYNKKNWENSLRR